MTDTSTCNDCRFYLTCESAGLILPACSDFLPVIRRTLFDRITSSPEVLAEKLVYCVPVPLFDPGAGLERWYTVFSPFDAKKYFRTKEEAIAATVAKLKEIED